MIKKFKSPIDECEFLYQIVDGQLSYRIEGTNWQDFILEDKRAYNDEVWEEYRVANCLSDDQLYALEQSSETGTLPEIELETNKRFEELINI